MIRVACIWPTIHTMIPLFGQFHTSNAFKYVMVFLQAPKTQEEYAIVQKVQKTNVSIYIGWSACLAAIEWADMVHLEWVPCHKASDWDDKGFLYALATAQKLGKPHLASLRRPEQLPPFPTLTVCATDAISQMQSPEGHFVTILDGVDTAQFTPPARSPQTEITITQICPPAKYGLFFWPALKQILHDYPQVRLWIVGNKGSEQLSTERVTFWGQPENIKDVLQKTDILAAAVYPEFGVTDVPVLEALAMGIPCVVTESPTFQNVVIDNQTGFLTPFGDVDGLAARIRRLVESEDLRRRLGETAVRHIHQHHQIQHTIAAYEATYQTILLAYQQAGAPPQNSAHQSLLQQVWQKTHILLQQQHRLQAQLKQSYQTINQQAPALPDRDDNPIYLPIPRWQPAPSAETGPRLQEIYQAIGDKDRILERLVYENPVLMTRELNKEVKNFAQELGLDLSGKP